MIRARFPHFIYQLVVPPSSSTLTCMIAEANVGRVRVVDITGEPVFEGFLGKMNQIAENDHKFT